MARKLSRRSVVRGAVGAALAGAAAPLAASPLALQEKPAPDDPALDRQVDALEKQLAHPLAPDVKKLMRTAVKNLNQEMADRVKQKLPENSEPCFVFIPGGVAR